MHSFPISSDIKIILSIVRSKPRSSNKQSLECFGDDKIKFSHNSALKRKKYKKTVWIVRFDWFYVRSLKKAT
jgi:hypothetical protein